MISVAKAMSGAPASRRRPPGRLQRRAMQVSPALGIALLLGACADSARFSTGVQGTGRYSTSPYSTARVIPAPVDDIVPAPGRAPAPAVVSTPLPPPPGADAAQPPATPDPAIDLSRGQDPAATLNQSQPSPAQVAALPSSPPPAAPPPAVAPSRTSVTGSWRASEASGSSCRVTLSSSPSLDLYKASSSGCASQDLGSVNAWDLRGNEVYLYARGNVVARLRGSGGNFNGVLAKSGAPVSLSR
ncbi:AprI/Inh family metalloprotease inhibitor [Pseudochelatococcus sp.]|uniref:AprI/Inh family metalloprotease inhibitor n=1 Tax=Pseudochelatococcus sp. TaxID=2020869 RepID=UPI003D8BE914